MLRLMIVEDEDIIIQGLEKTVDWSALGYQVVASARDGREALSLLERTRPDVILTDIKMPEMDGIELLRQAREREPGIEVVLLSGYEEFQYAKKGMDYGAFAYVLKLDLFRELPGVFRRLHAHLMARQEQSRDVTELRSFRKSRNLLDLFGGLETDVGWLEGMLSCVVVGWLPKTAHGQREVPVGATGLGRIAVARDERYRFFLYHGAMARGEFERQLQMEVKRLESHWRSGDSAGFLVGVGETAETPAQVTGSFHAAMKACDWGRTRGQQGVLWYAAEGRTRTWENPSFNRARVSLAVTLNDKKALLSLLHAEFERSIASSNIRIPSMQSACSDLVVQLTSALSAMEDGEGMEVRSKEIGSRINETCSMLDLLDLMDRVVGELCDETEHRRERQYFRNMEKAVEFVDAHCCSSINMNDLARQFSMSPSQFSRKFYEKRNVHFTEYLRSKRLELACTLLKTTGMRVGDIAVRVGYPDEKHFYKVFKTAFAVSPDGYRKASMNSDRTS